MKFKRAIGAVLSAAVAFSFAAQTAAAEYPVKAAAAQPGFELYNNGVSAGILIDFDSAGKTEYKQVVRAATDLQNDIKAVTGASAVLTADKTKAGKTAVIAGTVGHSDIIDELVSSGRIDVSDITGKWEAFTIKIVENPFAGCDSALVVAGSDKRGTIYGIYEISQAIGVSPWYWWGDVEIVKKQSVVLTGAEIEKTEAPDVKFRGIFINDERNLTNWSEKFKDELTSPGTPNPEMYKRVFELMLRLKANTLWPAMHNYSTGFNVKINPETGKPFNAEAADDYGIIMGASHCEMLLRNNEAEWAPWCRENEGKYGLTKVNNDWNQSYDYTVNPQAMNQYWRERVAVNYKYDNLYTIGLRGVHDSGINCKNLSNPTYENKAKVVKQAVEAQLAILSEYEQKYFEETGEHKEFPKIYCPYKEAAEYFKFDLSLPSDTYILWADDNYGYLRAMSSSEQLSKYQGGGVYYHISYWGRPISTLWVASTPLTLMYEELAKTYNSGADDVFILNVGDIKPGEIPIEFFMRFCWRTDRYDQYNLNDYTEDFARRNFGLSGDGAKEFADILSEHYQTTFAKRPEFHCDRRGTEFSLVNYGDEAQTAVNKMISLCERSEALMASLPQSMRDSYYQMVHYMIRASRLSFEKNYYQQKNQLYYAQGRFASVNAYAKASLDAYAQILSDVTYYNRTVSGGKWNGILNPYVSGLPQPVGSPSPISYVSELNASEGVGSVCEGQTVGTEDITLNFNSLTDDTRFIDVFNRGKTPQNYKITVPAPLKILTAGTTALEEKKQDGKTVYSGTVEVDDRVWVAVDWAGVSEETTELSVTVSDDTGETTSYPVKIIKSKLDPEAEKLNNNGYYETDGEVSIEAEHYSKKQAVNGQEWILMPGLGRCGDSMKVYPDLSAKTNETRIDSDFETASPYLEYKVHFETAGEYIPVLYRLPTLNEGHTCRIGVQFDSGAVSLFKGNTFADDADTGPWSVNVLEGAEKLTLSERFNVTEPGWHTVRIYKSDAGMVVDKLVLTNASQPQRESHLGAPESFNTISYGRRQTLAKGPEFKLSGISYPQVEQKYYYDFTDQAMNASEGYVGIDNKVKKSAVKRYEWDDAGFDKLSAAKRTAAKASARDNTIIYSSSDAAISFKMPGAGKYLVSLAIGDRLYSGVSVKGMNVSANGEQVIGGLDVAGGRTVEKGFIVSVGEDGVLKLSLSGVWAIAAVEISEYIPPQQNDGYTEFIPDSRGTINIEAEAALENSEYAFAQTGTDSIKSEWTMTSGKSGCGLFAGPNMDNNYSNTNLALNKGAKLNYRVNFKAKGSYSVWALVKSQCSDDDSLLVALDSGSTLAANDFGDTKGEFIWVNMGALSVSAPGIKTLTVCEREDGLTLDKLVLTRLGGQPAGTGGEMLRDSEKVDFAPLDAQIQTALGLLYKDYGFAQLVNLRKALLNACYVKTKQNVTNAETAAALNALTAAVREIMPDPLGVKISGAPAYVKAGESVKLAAQVLPAAAYDKAVSWSSSNTGVAAVSANGTVSAKSAGRAVVTARTVNGKTAKATIVVKSAVTKVSVKKAAYKLKAGLSLTIGNVIKSTNPPREFCLPAKYTLTTAKKQKKYVKITRSKITALKKGRGKTIAVTIKNGGKKVGSFKIKIK